MSNITGNIGEDEIRIVAAARDFMRVCDIRYPDSDGVMIALRRFANAIRIECLKDARGMVSTVLGEEDDPEAEPSGETSDERDARQAQAEDAADAEKEYRREMRS